MNRPRVSYLRKKMESMDIQQDVFSAVSSNLFSSLRAVKKHVFSDNFKILHTSRSVGNLSMSKNDESLPKIDKTRLKIIKELKNTQINLKNNLFQLTQNENLLKSESFISLTGKTANTLDNSLHHLKLKKIAQSKERIMERISEIETKINTLIYQESKEEGLMKMISKDKFQKFLENYENERESYNQRLNEITKESEMRRQRMLNDLENKINMKTKALQTQEEEKENLKKQKLLQNREEEKEKTSLRTKTNNQKLLRVKVFLNEKNQNKKYSYVEYAKKFEINEEKLIIKENKKRKQYMKHINNEEFIEFGKRLDEIKDYNYYFQFTLTGYGNDVEANLPNKKTEMIPIFQELSEKIGKQRVIWRYDPIFFSDRYTKEYHLKAFKSIAEALSGYTEKCVISFVDVYPKNKKNMDGLSSYELNDDELREFAQELSKIATDNNIKIGSCAEKIDLDECGIVHNCCIDRELIEKIIGCKLNVGKDKNQRIECGCVESVEIGTYNTCKNGCAYCYANYSSKSVETNAAKYDPLSPLLCGKVQEDDKITIRKVESLKETQLSIFDM